MSRARRLLASAWLVVFFHLLAGCSEERPSADQQSSADATSAAVVAPAAETTAAPSLEQQFAGRELPVPQGLIVADPAANAERTPFFGDLHVHTTYSFDAFAFGTLATPYDAYRYARGEAIHHPAGYEVQLSKPLDFYAVTDHAMFLGAVAAAADTTTEFSKLPHVQGLHNLNRPDNMNIASLPQRLAAFGNFLPQTLSGIADGSIDAEMVNDIARSAWADIIAAAQSFNDPGKFTTFVGFEYTTSSDDRGNLHRNVIFRDADRLPTMPFSRFNSQNPEGLWDWMDNLRDEGIEALAIPHNSNGSNGQMFKLVDWAGNPLDDAYSEQRLRNEPLVEITQIKGTSETHPALSMNDEWADFEIMPYRIATMLPSQPSGSYVREALLNGLMLEDQGIDNPYRFGFVGGSDTHTGAASMEEDNYFSKVGLVDGTAARRGSVPLTPEAAEVLRAAGRSRITEIDGEEYVAGAYETWGASGLTGVWAEENTRDALYRAFRRKETFATSGPRLSIRLFAGFGFEAAMLDEPDVFTRAYAEGVAMGSELQIEGMRAPTLLAWATRDVNSAPLQRLQIVKGWTSKGKHHEQVFDVACSDGGVIDPLSHRCPDNGASVNLQDCSISANVGAGELRSLWRDPAFNPEERAFYYARVLENPTCRWSTWDAIRAGVAPRSDLHQTIQERAWSSPIWAVPAV